MKERLLGVADVAVGGQNLFRASLGTAPGLALEDEEVV